MAKKKGDENIVALLNSCVEGRTGEWDCSCEEGREAFEVCMMI